MRKIIVYIATSADGFIARRGGGIDWLDRPHPRGNYGMGAFYRSIDTVIMGRKTWDLARSFGQTSYPGKQNYIFSRRRRRHNDVEFVRQSAATFARALRRTKGAPPAYRAAEPGREQVISRRGSALALSRLTE
jgi:dihydrofolate reductase